MAIPLSVLAVFAAFAFVATVAHVAWTFRPRTAAILVALPLIMALQKEWTTSRLFARAGFQAYRFDSAEWTVSSIPLVAVGGWALTGTLGWLVAASVVRHLGRDGTAILPQILWTIAGSVAICCGVEATGTAVGWWDWSPGHYLHPANRLFPSVLFEAVKEWGWIGFLGGILTAWALDIEDRGWRGARHGFLLATAPSGILSGLAGQFGWMKADRLSDWTWIWNGHRILLIAPLIACALALRIAAPPVARRVGQSSPVPGLILLYIAAVLVVVAFLAHQPHLLLSHLPALFLALLALGAPVWVTRAVAVVAVIVGGWTAFPTILFLTLQEATRLGWLESEHGPRTTRRAVAAGLLLSASAALMTWPPMARDAPDPAGGRGLRDPGQPVVPTRPTGSRP